MTMEKEESEITFSDFASHPLWRNVTPEEEEFYDVYSPRGDAVVPREFDGFVVTDFVAASGEKFVGTLEPAWNDEADTTEFTHPLLAHHQIRFRADGSPAWAALKLGTYTLASHEKGQQHARKVKASLGAAPLFPMTVTPRRQVEGFPRTWTLQGFFLIGESDKVVWIA